MSFAKKRLCIKCNEREPPVDTILEPGVNISEARYGRSDYICDECFKLRQKLYQNKGKWAEYMNEKKLEAIQEFSEQWNDKAFKKIENISDRVRMVWSKYNRRKPESGLRRDWICEVIFKELWNIDPNGIVEDWLKNARGIRESEKLNAKRILLQFVSDTKTFNLLSSGYKDRARNRWTGIVNSIVRKYAGVEKIVASPPFTEPVTKARIDNWYLLTREPEREKREYIRNGKIERFETINEQEKRIVRHQEGIEQEEREKKTRSEDRKDSNENKEDEDQW